MVVSYELDRIEKEAILVSAELLYEVSPGGLKITVNSLISCQCTGQVKKQKHPNKREVVICKRS